MCSAEAAATDHVLDGWIFFSIVILLLIAVGLPFREDGEPDPVNLSPMTPDPSATRRGLIAGLAVAALAALGPAIVLGLSQASAMPEMALKPFDLTPSCVAYGAPTTPDAVGRAIVQRITCGRTAMMVEIGSVSRPPPPPRRSTASAVT